MAASNLAQQLVNAAMGSVGHCYSFGGTPGTNGQGCWDCSSAVNYWLGAKCGAAIPGFAAGAYSGSSHGPDVSDYVMWSGASTIGSSEVQAGDLVLFPPNIHMGVAISSSSYVSAEDPSQGTQVSAISDGQGLPMIRRITGAGTAQPITSAQTTSWLSTIWGLILPGASESIGGEAGALLDPSNWVDWAERGALMLFGGVLILIGLWRFTGDNRSMKTVVLNDIGGAGKAEESGEAGELGEAAEVAAI
jgi:hypothetical protein